MQRTSRVSVKTRAVCVALASLLTVYMPGGASAAEGDFNFFLAGAYPLTLGVTHQWMNGQYGILGGFGYEDDNWPVGLQFEGMNYHFGFSDRADQFTQSEGYMQITAGTANITWTPEQLKDNSIEPRLITGIGVYNRVLRTTEVRPFAGSCFDPWWGYYPCAGTGTVITNSNSQTKFGVNVGGGVDFEINPHTSFFVEARYHHVFTSHKETQFMPFNFGIRW